jgi:hypothetical protein
LAEDAEFMFEDAVFLSLEGVGVVDLFNLEA